MTIILISLILVQTIGNKKNKKGVMYSYITPFL